MAAGSVDSLDVVVRHSSYASHLCWNTLLVTFVQHGGQNRLPKPPRTIIRTRSSLTLQLTMPVHTTDFEHFIRVLKMKVIKHA
jgi:hypothetical protein